MVCDKLISARPTIIGINLDLSWELDRWWEYANGLSELGAGADLWITSAGHLAGIENKMNSGRFRVRERVAHARVSRL